MFNAIYAAQHPQNFLFNAQAVETSGNPWPMLSFAEAWMQVVEYSKLPL